MGEGLRRAGDAARATERLPRMTETAWRSQVEELALAYGWRVYYVINSTRVLTRRSGMQVRGRNINPNGKGFPDLTLVRVRRGSGLITPPDARIIYAELKRDLGPQGGGQDVMPDPDQVEWGRLLTAFSDAVVWGTAAYGSQAIRGYRPVEHHVWRPSDYDEVEKALR
jgi:hypothetical protein